MSKAVSFDGALYATLVEKLSLSAIQAGEKIMEVYHAGIDVEYKSDSSPVTQADAAAEEIILADLAKYAPDIPVVAEESAAAGNIPDVSDLFWLVDPLDGTKEFINKGQHFTVNIALIKDAAPIFGIIYVPVLRTLYRTTSPTSVEMAQVDEDLNISTPTALNVRDIPESGPVGVASKSHRDPETNAFLEKHNIRDTKSVGSSLKFCLLADGSADIYPRFGPTMEWDTGAGDAIVRAAGGKVTHPDGRDFQYGKDDYRNGAFIACGKMNL